jgi:8-oxo-dGTP pyrophosphatase MutT (NUDIX family)
MADTNKVLIEKIGLLLLHPDGKRFLVCEKRKGDMTQQYIMPGGQVEEGENDYECLAREIWEELEVELRKEGLAYLGEYTDVAAGDESKQVSIRLYRGRVQGKPKPSAEIYRLHWIGREDLTTARVSPIVRTKILPDMLARGILKRGM